MDLNADIGEGAPDDEELLEVVTSASIACGVHAGGSLTMLDRARRAVERGVVVGAHPSYDDREGFGRRPMHVNRDELLAGVVDQIFTMAGAARVAGTRVRFVKPHGALYNQAAADPAIAETVVAAVAQFTGVALLGPAGSQMLKQAAAAGIPTYAEAFADRAYTPDGTLVGRDSPGSVRHETAAVVRQAVELAVHHRVTAANGAVLEMKADSICLHGDTPGAAALGRAVRRALEDAGVAVAPFLPG